MSAVLDRPIHALPSQGTAVRRGLALLVMGASGAAALGYQIVWTQQFGLWLGHESAAVLAVLAAFFGGLAIGALLLGARIEASARPARWYAACEAVIGVWGAVLALALPPAAAWLVALTGAQPAPAWQWAVAFVGTLVLLLPATVAMGATLPAMERVLAPLQRQGPSIASLYAANTLGAVVGVLAAAFWLVPTWGLLHTAGLCVALNLLCALLASRWPDRPAERAAVPATSSPSGLGLMAATGLLGIAYEVLVVRVLSQVAENTVYTFAMLLAVYLVGTALGAAACQRWLRRDEGRLRDQLLCALALACAASGLALWGAETLKAATLQALGPGFAAALAAEAVLALAAFLLPTFVMGALFSQLSTHLRAGGVSFARALGVNTLGAALAPLIVGVLLLPAWGAKGVLLAIVVGYALLAVRAKGGAVRAALGATVAACAAAAVWAPPLVFVDVPEGGHVVSYREGAMAAVSVVEDAEGVSRLRINNRQQEGSSASLTADARQALLPLLLHPAPRRALFLGLGTGVTATSAAQDPALQVDVVELLPEVIEASAHFDGAWGESSPRPASMKFIAADARRFVRSEPGRYDLIVADNFHPARSGSGALYTVEHFRAVRERLAEDGLFVQWLPLHQLDIASLRSIVAAFLAANPQAWAMLATHSLQTPVLGLVMGAGEHRFDVARVQQRVASIALPRPPAAFGLGDGFSLLGSFVAGPSGLARFAAGVAVNTDDLPVVTYRAPRITYAPDSLPRDRLLSLLQTWRVEPSELVTPAPDAAWPARLSAYMAARDHFITAGRDVQPSADVQRMLAQVRGPLLETLRISPDFRPAYDPLLAMAGALARSDRDGARDLLRELARLQPARPEALQRLRQLEAAQPLPRP